MTANARRIKARADENLKHLPNYTCTETIQRSLRTSRRDRLRPTDTVHLDVAYVAGKELFGRPGEHRIDQPDIAQLVTKPIGNGQFALFVKSIFLGQRAKFGPPVKTRRAGKQAHRYDYTIPVAQKWISHPVGCGRGDCRLQRVALGDDGPVSIGGQLFPLPLRSQWETGDVFGEAARNVTAFENCHEFIGESVLKFGDPEGLLESRKHDPICPGNGPRTF